jgi:Transposase DDE domain
MLAITDPESRLYKKAKGKESKLCYMGHALMENRNGLAVGGKVSHCPKDLGGTAEREASEVLLAAKVKETGKPATVGEDKAYDVAEHGAALRKLKVTPHVARSETLTKTGKRRKSVVSDKMAASEGYAMSQTRRKLIECVFGWGKQHRTLRKTKHRGIAQVTSDFLLNIIAYNLIRIPKLIAA